MMDLMQEAILLGFSGAAVMDTKELVFVPEYRTFCEENLCENGRCGGNALLDR